MCETAAIKLSCAFSGFRVFTSKHLGGLGPVLLIQLLAEPQMFRSLPFYIHLFTVCLFLGDFSS